MNKWTVRLIGIAILFAAALILFDRWFTPDIPPIIQQSIELSVRGGETHTISPPPPAANNDRGNPRPPSPPPQPAFTLASLDEDSSEPQPILSNPNGSDKAKAREAEQAAANQKAASQEKPANNALVENSAEAAPAVEKTAEKPKPRRGGSWVQAGSFSSKENADKMIAQLKKRGWPIDTEIANINGKDMHRVFIGPLSAADASTYIDILGKEGTNARQVNR
ncbi:SPOR domain-containing protein [Cardiobacterium sp. Marseille-Q4385]|uniref:SPOR domain-containing protein n=1 Tax=Cardiobacterium sp. Marseille-Q4385 TaxID=2866573 RepID=UPI001CE3EB9D|nr:SPOR domain-containing protein [Cardiobacterium sp. Marseille-Q4385]